MQQSRETITQRKDGRFMGRFIIDHSTNGKPVYQYVYGRTYDEAEQKLRIARDIESQYLSGRSVTIYNVYQEWMNAIMNRVKESTFANYRMKFEKHILPVFGEMLCTSINSAKLNVFIKEKLDSGLSAEVESGHYHQLRHTFATNCIENGYDAKTLSIVLGHSTIALTLERYVHPNRQYERRMMNSLSTRM